jgi:hypothetical protein
MSEALDLQTLQSILAIIDTAAQRGAFKPEEFEDVGAVRNRLARFLKIVMMHQEEEHERQTD